MNQSTCARLPESPAPSLPATSPAAATLPPTAASSPPTHSSPHARCCKPRRQPTRTPQPRLSPLQAVPPPRCLPLPINWQWQKTGARAWDSTFPVEDCKTYVVTSLEEIKLSHIFNRGLMCGNGQWKLFVVWMSITSLAR